MEELVGQLQMRRRRAKLDSVGAGFFVSSQESEHCDKQLPTDLDRAFEEWLAQSGTQFSMCESMSGREETHELDHQTRSRTRAWNLDSCNVRQTWTLRQLPDIRAMEPPREPSHQL